MFIFIVGFGFFYAQFNYYCDIAPIKIAPSRNKMQTK